MKIKKQLTVGLVAFGIAGSFVPLFHSSASANVKSVYVSRDGYHYFYQRKQVNEQGRVYRIPLNQARQRGFIQPNRNGQNFMPHHHINRFFR
ncbi:hypothetical protein ACYATM_05835 [Lactobacillaceae bacterium Scapto_B20]